jgi:hypothetical protein
MNRHHKIVKTSSGLSTGKALFKHIIFSPSQTGETVPLTIDRKSSASEKKDGNFHIFASSRWVSLPSILMADGCYCVFQLLSNTL